MLDWQTVRNGEIVNHGMQMKSKKKTQGKTKVLLTTTIHCFCSLEHVLLFTFYRPNDLQAIINTVRLEIKNMKLLLFTSPKA